MLYGDLRYCIPRGRRGFMSPEANKGLRGRQRYNSCIQVINRLTKPEFLLLYSYEKSKLKGDLAVSGRIDPD